MAEALYHLGDSLTWTPTSAPRGELVLVQDCVEAGGGFLVHHFASLFLKAGHRVCFVASANSPEHYAAVGRKLGVNFAACQAKKQLQLLDWTKMEATSDKEAGWVTLFDQVKSFASQEQEKPVSIVLDDVSPLKWQFGDAAVLDFVRSCKTLTHDKNGAANVVVLGHADTDLTTSRPLSPALADMATVVLATKPLPTGYSKDIHGTLCVYRQHQGLSCCSLHEEPAAIPYKILESTVKCFHSEPVASQTSKVNQGTMEAQEIPTKPRDEYKQLEHIGRGTYGDVFLCEVVETGERVCMKEVDLTFLPSDDRMRCLNEVALLKQLPPHPNIVRFRDAFWAECTGSSAQVLVLILEYADGGDLENHIHSLAGLSMLEEEARRIFLQLAQAIHHLHSHRVVHRDLKSSNVFLFRTGRVVLGDFGSSKRLPSRSGSEFEREAEGLTSTVVGSPLYLSPEMLEGEPHGFATDIWSLGCVLYELVSGGKPAFTAPSYPAVVYRITQGTYDPLEPTSVALEVRNLVAKMLQKDPQARLSIADVLQTSWLGTHGVLAESLELESSRQGEMNADQHNLGSNTVKQSLVPPTTPNLLDNSIEVSTSKQTFLLPPPAPAGIAVPSRGRIHRLQRPRREASHVRDPLVRLDVDPPPPPVLPPRKHVSKPTSIPFKHVLPAQTLAGLEIRGVRITGTARLQKPTSAPKPHKVSPQ